MKLEILGKGVAVKNKRNGAIIDKQLLLQQLQLSFIIHNSDTHTIMPTAQCHGFCHTIGPLNL